MPLSITLHLKDGTMLCMVVIGTGSWFHVMEIGYTDPKYYEHCFMEQKDFADWFDQRCLALNVEMTEPVIEMSNFE